MVNFRPTFLLIAVVLSVVLLAQDSWCPRDCSSRIRLYAEDGDLYNCEETPLPIDTVSFDLARKHFQTLRNKVPEKNIQYGHLKVPIDNPSTKKFRDTPEHQLYTIDKTIFELKPPKSIHNDDMEASSEEEDEPPCLGGYKAFGYHDAVFKAKKFQVKSVTHSDSDLCRPMHRGTGCCGGGHAHGRWARQHYWNHHSSYGHEIRPYDYID